MPTVLLALGTNVGERVENLRTALEALSAQVQLMAQSFVYDTDPRYVTDQPRFLNMAVQGNTALSPHELLDFVKSIERELGRTPSVRFGPRLIDIDILFYGEEIVALPDLVIPHPRLPEREFVLRPLADIAPNWEHPQTGQTVAEMLAALPADAEVVRQAIKL